MTTELTTDLVTRLRDVGCDREAFTPSHAKCICRLANAAADEIEALRNLHGVGYSGAHVLQDAIRYQWLRSRDLDTIEKGGAFVGLVPQNLVLNGRDLDNAVDDAMKRERGTSASGA